MKKFVVAGLGVAIALLLASCADRPMGAPGDPAFVRGLIDGLLAPLAFVVSLFTDDIRMYAFPNVGRWYDFGFLLGIGAWGGGGSHVVRRYIYVDRRTGQTVEERIER
ncbi:putative membrane protein [Asticcacaulis biprosthecium C19]|uniref:Putative membrane protein n=1 Tax=Asticcacaulis biprosthecium C19 TaxID=715226 RepID=F4QKZ4_9CAUL|nr:hypothetical protein [Asticcacaulis biprosthecium]EGF92217.1 putative membrane protein [Asticcacaulis biprosthecium C19]